MTRNNLDITTFLFPGGEWSVRINKPEELINSWPVSLTWGLSNASAIICLLLLVDAIRRVYPSKQIHLNIPYFPYARQDRVCNEGEALSVKVMADLINGLRCEQVTIYDPHSDVTPALLNNCKVLTIADLIPNTSLGKKIKKEKLTLVAPDAGAEKRVRMLAKALDLNAYDIVYAQKERDPSTGEITDIRINRNWDAQPPGEDFIIIDDICDGGRTFTELTKVLKDHGARKIYLYVTHGIFSNPEFIQANYFDHIYCWHRVNGNHEHSNSDYLGDKVTILS